MTPQEQKQLFAEALLRAPNQPVVAARAVFPLDPGKAFIASTQWPHDAEVLAYQRQLLDRFGAKHFMPTKEQLAMIVLLSAEETNFSGSKKHEYGDRLKAYELYAKILGFIERPGINVQNNTMINNVMVVRDHGTNEDWASKAANQQKALLTHASSPTAIN